MKQVLCYSLVLLATQASAAGLLVPQGSKATLTVDYDYVAIGSKSDKYDPKDWSVKRKISIISQMVADAPATMPSVHALDAAQQADLKNKQASGVKVQKKMAPMMADMEKIAAKCGDDEGCLEREVGKYANGIQMTPELMSTGKEVEAIGKQGPARYQLWRVVAQSGSYSIDETYNGQSGDPDCEGQPNKRCVRQETRKGGGNLPALTGSKAAGSALTEVDDIKKDMMLSLPMALSAMPNKRVVRSNFPGEKSGSTEMIFAGTAELADEGRAFSVTLPAGLKTTAGTRTVKMKGVDGESGSWTISWRFVTP
jgi:hypothetical protein